MEKFELKKNWSLFAVILAVLMLVAMLTGCNKQLVDVTYSYERAILYLPNGEVIDGKVQSWKDFDDGDQIQVKIGGKQYLIHSENVVLISN